MKTILISGKAGHGKTTFANFLTEELEQRGYVVLQTSFGNLLKDMCSRYWGWNGEKDEFGRSLLQTIGTEIVRAKDDHFWTDFVKRFASIIEPNFLVIDDWRFIEEYERLGGDITTVKVERYDEWTDINVNIPYTNPAMTEEQLNHKSESELDDFACDFIIVNNGIENVRDAACGFLQEMNW